MKRARYGFALAGGLLPAAAVAQNAAPVVLPTIEVIETAPVPGGAIDRDKVPATTHEISTADLDHAKSTSVPDALQRRVPGVTITDVTGNPFQPDVQYRGFVASPVIGTPQGLAVYQNGVRVNEVFGDTVNWDLIPDAAISRMTVIPNNPVFGLNALGGAVTVEMKNGFTYHGEEAEIRGGSFGRRAATVQAGGQDGNLSAYVLADGLYDDGWRDRSPSGLRRLYADVGARGDQSEFHVSLTAASNNFGAVGPTPIELLNQRWSSVYTTPQITRNDLAFLTASGNYRPTDTLSIQGNLYYRGFWQSHVDGNTSNAQPCSVPAGFLCLGDDTTVLFGPNGQPIPNILNGAVPGEVDRTWTSANSFGGSLQATSTTQLLGHDNHLVVGTSLDHGRVGFTADSQLGTVGQDLFVTATGAFIQQPSGDIGPVSLLATTTYTGLYATDTFDITSKAALTAGGRFNLAQIRLDDQIGTALNGSAQYSRFNPVIGTTYKIAPNLTAFAGYSEANRAPTPLELACADPVRPCLIDNFLVSDPPLKQVVSHTYEAGLRGSVEAEGNGRIAWNVGAFRTGNSDDILNVASPIPGHGFFQNAGSTRRQGMEASATYRADRWSVFANYSYVDATFQSLLALSSPNNPAADANGLIFVVPGDRIPSIPRHRVKAGAEYAVTGEWKLGADLIAVSSQFLQGDASNQNPQLPAYWVVNFHTTYQVSKTIELFGLVQNVFNRRFYTFGTFFDPAAVPFLGLTDPRTLTPGVPLVAYAGIRATF